MNLCEDTSYLRATLREAILDLNARQNVPLGEAIRNSRVIEAVLLLLDRVDALEGKTPPAPPTTDPKFQDRSFIIPFAGEELCRPENRQQAEAAGYEVIGQYQVTPGQPLFKLARRPV